MKQDAASPRAGGTGDVTHVPSPVLPFYVHSVIAIGVGAIVWSLPALVRIPHAIVWMLFTALALLTGRFTMKIASLSANISVTDTFFIASAMFFGPEAATIAVARSVSMEGCVTTSSSPDTNDHPAHFSSYSQPSNSRLRDGVSFSAR